MKFKENCEIPNGFYVSFGPSVMNKDIFRVDLAKRLSNSSLSVSLDACASTLIDSYRNTLVSSYRGELKQVDSHSDFINGFPAKYFAFEQVAHTGTIDYSSLEIYHVAYIVDYGDAVVCFWVQSSSKSGVAAKLTPRKFAESLKLRISPLAISGAVGDKSSKNSYDDYPSASPKPEPSPFLKGLADVVIGFAGAAAGSIH
jgi:hypothetical protein